MTRIPADVLSRSLLENPNGCKLYIAAIRLILVCSNDPIVEDLRSRLRASTTCETRYS